MNSLLEYKPVDWAHEIIGKTCILNFTKLQNMCGVPLRKANCGHFISLCGGMQVGLPSDFIVRWYVIWYLLEPIGSAPIERVKGHINDGKNYKMVVGGLRDQ